MGNTLAFVKLTEAFTHARHEVNPLLDIFPGSVFRKFLNVPYLYSIFMPTA